MTSSCQSPIQDCLKFRSESLLDLVLQFEWVVKKEEVILSLSPSSSIKPQQHPILKWAKRDQNGILPLPLQRQTLTQQLLVSSTDLAALFLLILLTQLCLPLCHPTSLDRSLIFSCSSSSQDSSSVCSTKSYQQFGFSFHSVSEHQSKKETSSRFRSSCFPEGNRHQWPQKS